MKNIAFIINPMSGTQNKRRLPKLINELLDKRQWLENIVFTERQGHALSLAKQFAAMGFDAVVAVGGDGTVREVAEGIAGSRSALGIIPMGTTNTLARHLTLPLRFNAALTWLNRSEPVLCDTIEVLIDGSRRLIAMTDVTIGDKQLINCAQGVKTSIQDGQLELRDSNGIQPADCCTNCNCNGTITVDGDEYEADQNVNVRILPDSVYVLVQKRF